MKKIILLLLGLSTMTPAAELSIEPVYGFERVYQQAPKPARYKTEAFIGIRGVYGTALLAGELELNQSNSSNTVGETKADISTQKILLGLRLVPISSQYYSLYLRGGIRGQKVSRDLSTNGASSSDNSGVSFDPYAGAGLTLNLAGIIALNTSATLVFNKDAASSEQYDTRYTFSVSFKFGSSTSL